MIDRMAGEQDIQRAVDLLNSMNRGELPMFAVHESVVCLLEVGDVVDVSRWNRSEPPWNRMRDPVKVESVDRDGFCESGFMVGLRDADGDFQQLDANWIARQ